MQVYNQMKQPPSLVRHLQSPLLTKHRLPYTSSGNAKSVASNTRELQMGATVYGDGSDKLDAACLVLKTLTSALLKQLLSVVVLLL